MGELKELRDSQETLLQNVKTWANKLYLAGLGAYAKANDGSEALYEKYAANGAQAYGEAAEGKSKLALVSRGAMVSARQLLEEAPHKRHQLYEQCIATGKQERGDNAEHSNEFVLAGLGALSTLRQQSQKLFEDLVTAGTPDTAESDQAK